MTFRIEVLSADGYPRTAATHIAGATPARGSVVLTGGTTAEKIYPFLALERDDWSELEVAFSDERCVPPDDPASNYKMAKDLLLEPTGAHNVHRMPGEDEPDAAAAAYHEAIAPLVEGGWDLMLLGVGADAHVGALFPGTPGLQETKRYCAPVDRPDGMKGLTLTPPALRAARKILLLVTGEAKAATMKRVTQGDEGVDACPARLLADHPDATFLLDEPAASLL